MFGENDAKSPGRRGDCRGNQAGSCRRGRGSWQQQGIRPGLAAVLVGHVPASEIYVRSKVQTCAELGLYQRPDHAAAIRSPPKRCWTWSRRLNDRDDIDGILIQLPLPKQVDAKALLDAVLPAKDVDGFHPVNAGRLQAGRPALAPCTPAGVIEILKRSELAHQPGSTRWWWAAATSWASRWRCCCCTRMRR